MEVKAEARYIRVSPQKARLVVDLIRGRKANDAIITLRTVNKRIAPAVEKVLHSAIANAQNKSERIFFRSLRTCATINHRVSRLYLHATSQTAGDDIADSRRRFN